MVKHEKSTLGWGAAGLVALGILVQAMITLQNKLQTQKMRRVQ
ncbi:hypothetical protein BANRA_04055 [Acinetobacter baumannii]|nr:hypothetical protein BANRA_01490 [Acinetobacter baumannii]VCX77340.1 hypothetical protein BANRA_03377 [Acinetobacter baumannii]VCX78010.1 hypothetical protein BANRA_04055 [Acinetobacter baumannii]